jgi:hypothetical protein
LRLFGHEGSAWLVFGLEHDLFGKTGAHFSLALRVRITPWGAEAPAIADENEKSRSCAEPLAQAEAGPLIPMVRRANMGFSIAGARPIAKPADADF